MISPMNVSGLRPEPARSRMRPSLMRRSLSRLLKAVLCCVGMAMAVRALNRLTPRLEAPAGGGNRTAKLLHPTNHLRPAGGGAFLLPSVGRFPSAPMPPCQTHATLRNRAKHTKTNHCGLRSSDLGTNRPSLCDGAAIRCALDVLDSCSRSASGSLELVGLSCFDVAGNSALDQAWR
jgi:hypothetical protein